MRSYVEHTPLNRPKLCTTVGHIRAYTLSPIFIRHEYSLKAVLNLINLINISD